MENRRIPVFPVIMGTLAGTASTALFLAVFAAACVFAGIPGSGPGEILAVSAAVIGAFCGGLVCAALAASRGMILGAVCAASMFILLLAACALSGGQIGISSLLRFALMLVSGALGGVLGVGRPRRVRTKIKLKV